MDNGPGVACFEDCDGVCCGRSGEDLEAGDRLDEFLDDFPTVMRDQAVALLERATAIVVSDSFEAAA